MAEDALKQARAAGFRKRIEAKDREIAQLRTALSLNGKMEEDTWATFAPQDVRDQIAATAYINGRLDPFNALTLLGFPPAPRGNGRDETAGRKEALKLAERIFQTEGVQRILMDEAKSVEENRRALEQRLVQIGRHGDDASSIRAIEQLSRMLPGWKAGDEKVAAAGAANIDNRRMNLFLMSGHERAQGGDDTDAIAGKVVEAASLLTHELGEAVRVPDEDEEEE
jgi:hypothetical protein